MDRSIVSQQQSWTSTPEGATDVGSTPRVAETGPRPSISLRWLVLIALAARLPAVLFSHGYEFLDEQFQYVDPAYHLATDSPYLLTHEWVAGIRSWVYPWLLSLVMRTAIALGLTGPEGQLMFVRAALAVVSLLAVVGVHQLLTDRRRFANDLPAWVFVLATSNGLIVYQSVHPNGLAMSCVLIVFAVGVFLRGGPWRSLLAGLAVGLAFCCRPQDAVYGFPLFVAGLYERRWRDAALLACGGLAMLAVQGGVDLATWGAFLHSPIEYVRFNLAHSAEFGQSQGWWFYPLIMVALAPILHTGLGFVMRGSRALPWVTISLVCSVAAHQLLARKAFRFVTSALVLWILVWAVGACRQQRPWRGWIRLTMVAAAVLHGAFLVVASVAFPNHHRVVTATVLTQLPENTGVVYCDLNPTDIGGYFYQRHGAEIRTSSRDALPSTLKSMQPDPSYVVTRRGEALALPSPWRHELVRSVGVQWGLRPNKGYDIHRVQRDREAPGSGR